MWYVVHDRGHHGALLGFYISNWVSLVQKAHTDLGKCEAPSL